MTSAVKKIEALDLSPDQDVADLPFSEKLKVLDSLFGAWAPKTPEPARRAKAAKTAQAKKKKGARTR